MARKKKEQNVIVSGRAPIVSVALGLCFSVAIAYNALGRQDVRHPAPFEGFWNLSETVEEKPRPLLMPRETKTRVPAAKPDPLIKQLQSGLTSLGYYDGTIDGLNGPQTRAAIKRYETDNELSARGKPTAELLDHIKFNQRIRDAVKQPEQTENTGGSERIRLVQTGLSELGYTPGPVDGVLGEQTKQAIRTFEQDRRLEVTGRVSDGLIRELQAITGLSSLKVGNGNG